MWVGPRGLRAEVRPQLSLLNRGEKAGGPLGSEAGAGVEAKLEWEESGLEGSRGWESRGAGLKVREEGRRMGLGCCIPAVGEIRK